jgi:hypothetical protein
MLMMPGSKLLDWTELNTFLSTAHFQNGCYVFDLRTQREVAVSFVAIIIE